MKLHLNMQFQQISIWLGKNWQQMTICETDILLRPLHKNNTKYLYCYTAEQFHPTIKPVELCVSVHCVKHAFYVRTYLNLQMRFIFFLALRLVCRIIFKRRSISNVFLNSIRNQRRLRPLLFDKQMFAS